MSLINKVKEAQRAGILGWKIKHKLFEYNFWKRSLYYIENKNARVYVRQCKDYNRLYKEFKPVIESHCKINESITQIGKVWICWFQGLENAPDIVQACVNSVKKVLSDKEIVLLTTKNYTDYIELPAYIIHKWQKGMIGMAHFSDILRISLLAKWGGMWIDSTVLCTDRVFFDEISSLPIFVFKQLDLINRDKQPILASSWFISSVSNNPIIVLTRDLLYAYWNKHDLLINYFVFHMFFSMACRKYSDEWNEIPTFNNNTPHVLMIELKNNYSEYRWNQIMRMSDIHKLSRYNDINYLENSNYMHIISKYYENKQSF